MEPTTLSDTESAKEGWSVFPLQVAALAGTYIASGWIGLEFASYHANATLIWPPTGICLAALVICGRRLWIGVWLGAFALSLMHGSPVSVCLGFAAGNTLMPVVGALLLVHVFDFRPTLERVRDVVALVLAGGALPATISAGIGVATLWLHGSLPASEIATVGSIWWAGDFEIRQALEDPVEHHANLSPSEIRTQTEMRAGPSESDVLVGCSCHIEAVGFVAKGAIDVAAEFTASLGCVASLGAEFVGQFSAAAEASVSVEVSVSASAEVGGST